MLLNALPYAVSLLALLNVVLLRWLGFNPLYFIGAPTMMTLLIVALHRRANSRAIAHLPQAPSRPILLYVAWIVLLLAVEGVSKSYAINAELAARGAGLMIWMPAFGLLLHEVCPKLNLRRFAVFIVWTGLLVAVLGTIQSVVSLNLFGLIPDIKWQTHFETSRAQFRAISIMGSPQVYGLYTVLCATVALCYEDLFGRRTRVLMFTLLTAGALLSGNRLVPLLAAIAVFLKFRKWTYRLGLLVAMGTVLVFIEGSPLDIDAPTIQRPTAWLWDMGTLISSERAGRLARYAFVLENSNPLTGLGLGSTTPTDGYSLVIPESQVLMVYAEAGVVPVILLGWFIALAVRQTQGLHGPGAILAVIVVSWLFVHAFTYPAFVVFWILMLAPPARLHQPIAEAITRPTAGLRTLPVGRIRRPFGISRGTSSCSCTRRWTSEGHGA